MLFRDLKAYQHALRVAALSRPLIKRLPASEHDLADQWRRASNSIALNLAEGITRKGSKEFRRFADMARGSLPVMNARERFMVSFESFRLQRLRANRCRPLRRLGVLASSIDVVLCRVLQYSMQNTVQYFP